MKRLFSAKFVAASLLALGALGAASVAEARSEVYFSIGVPAPVYVQPEPAYVQPPYYAGPSEVYVQPPVYAAPNEVYVRPGWQWYGQRRWDRAEWRRHEWREHHRQWERERRWQRRDWD